MTEQDSTDAATASDGTSDDGPFRTTEAATERARVSLEAAGHDDVGIDGDPYRTTSTWVVPATCDAGACNVHVDAATGRARVATIGR